MRNALLAAVFGLPLVWVACSASAPAQRSSAQATSMVVLPSDGGFEVSTTPPLGRKGVIVPGDNATTGIGDSTTPGSSTGTNGRSVGPTLGSPGN